MKIQFLGTGAADYDASHRHLSGYRRNASALIDGVLLIDPGPGVPDAIETFGVDAGKIRYVINTHPHSDHFNKETLATLEAKGAQFITLADGETKRAGAYGITALAANHSIKTQHFIIDDGEKKLFYGLSLELLGLLGWNVGYSCDRISIASS
jgi:glyoxylase-like metal-dependent hydrolase (beta-lactamase superfamily II)